ncbi:aldehyde dehydrogenase family protein [Actinomadura sp. DC4]|uniref:aldehyde dehydrogenase family protein n=1 Tax=Actinomadura sp. DC4 TaxID=3055069 RepID=UPI0025B0D5B6|nr:aldehyde dehydrogenase family protein [Actinomadura sp. DC4]MDN3356344.1 aldehyde dehydrogenase family protein [Actinomadura sp. DC4]
MIAEATALIAGEPYAPGPRYETVDPTTERVIATVADCSVEDADVAIRAAAGAAPAWAALPLDRRREALGTAAEHLDARREELVALAVADTGARPPVARETQVGAAIERLRSWSRMPAETLAMDGPGERGGVGARLRRAPVGVVACISPYNFPLLAMVGKVAPALFAGNTVVMKPAPQDPLLVVALAEALRDGLAAVGAPAAAACLLTGASAELGAALVRHDLVRAVSFTGSTAVGTQIHRDAAPGMKRLLLELGGKGACLVREDADLDAVIEAVTRTWTIQSGQVCLTTSRVIAADGVHDALVARLGERLASLRVGDPRDPATDVGPLISAAQRGRVESLVDGARAEGRQVIQGAPGPDTGYFTAPTLVLDCVPENRIMQEEVFGPVLCVMRTHDDEEAVAAVNSTRYGLSDYIFSADVTRARALAELLDSAQVGINTVRRHAGAPFGGNRASGVGRSGGRYALDAYTDIQTINEPASGSDAMADGNRRA